MIRTLFAVFFITSFAFGQDFPEKRNREFYLTLADFSPLNLHLKYKHQIGQRTYLKFGLVNLSASHSSSNSGSSPIDPVIRQAYSGGVEIGIEFRKQLSERFAIFHGPNLRYSYTHLFDKQDIPGTPVVEHRSIFMGHAVTVPYTVGVLFNLTPNLLLAAEINPAIGFLHSESRNEFGTTTATSSSDTFNFSLDNRGGLLSFVLRF